MSSESVKSVKSADSRKLGERDEESYVIDAGLKLLRLLECVEGRNFEPVTIKRLMQRTGFSRDLTRRLVITAKKGRWLKELVTTKERQFVPGPKMENLARNLMTSMLARSAAGQ
jgi:DNA-binding IclR family transcriptional regulator